MSSVASAASGTVGDALGDLDAVNAASEAIDAATIKYKLLKKARDAAKELV